MEHTKQKLTPEALVEHCKEKGITFDLISEQAAINYMAKNNYYFKLTSYRKNFKKVDGKYQNLDFEYLIDLANIDATLRRFIFNTTLNLEHALKTWVLNHITNDPNEDGYTIVDDFKNQNASAYNGAYGYMKQSYYSQDLFKKHRDDVAIWVLVGFMSFGQLTQFIEFYATRNNSREIERIGKIMRYAKNMRNITAHANPLLVNLFNNEGRLAKARREPAVVTPGRIMGISSYDLYDMKIHDLVALFALTKELISPEALEHVCRQAIEGPVYRFNKHHKYYEGVESIQHFNELFKKMIDYLNAE